MRKSFLFRMGVALMMVVGMSSSSSDDDFDFSITEGRFFCYTDKSHYFTNLTIQSIQIGLLVTVSTNTFAGCISSSTRRSEI